MGLGLSSTPDTGMLVITVFTDPSPPPFLQRAVSVLGIHPLLRTKLSFLKFTCETLTPNVMVFRR